MGVMEAFGQKEDEDRERKASDDMEGKDDVIKGPAFDDHIAIGREDAFDGHRHVVEGHGQKGDDLQNEAIELLEATAP